MTDIPKNATAIGDAGWIVNTGNPDHPVLTEKGQKEFAARIQKAAARKG